MTTVEEFSQHPDQLIELVREVIIQLKAQDTKGDKLDMETQLWEIARAIENLERKRVFVPDVLRAEKTRLAAAVEINSEASRLLNQLTVGLSDLILEVSPFLEIKPPTNPRKKSTRSQSKSPTTNKSMLRALIIDAIKSNGGQATKRAVYKYIEKHMIDRFLPRDLEWRDSTHNFIWQNNTDWERFRMVEDGVLKKGSPAGIWELNEEYCENQKTDY